MAASGPHANAPLYDEEAIRRCVPEQHLKQGTGSVPIKAEFVRERTARDASAAGEPADARLRGQNKGKDREHVTVAKAGGKPTFEGEKNFLFGDSFPRVKAVTKSAAWNPRRQRNEEAEAQRVAPAQPNPDAAPPAPQDAATAAGAATADAPADAPATAHEATKEALNRPPERQNVLATVVRRSDEPADVRRKRLFRDKLVLAPLTTVGNLPFRRICVNYGADVTVGEMAMVFNLNQTQVSEWSLLRRHESEKIFGIQVASGRGFDAGRFAMLLEATDFDVDFVDINCGCPVDLIMRRGCGCGLWEREGRMRDVVQNLVAGQGRPVTIKCRIGPSETEPALHKVIHKYEGWGADAVTIHGRSRKQRYTKLANWAYVNECAKLTNLPVIGNGDVFSLENFLERREVAPEVSSHMIARGALIKPWIFQEIKQERVFDIRSSERLDMLRDFANYGLAHWGSDDRGVATTRRYMCEWLSFLHRYVPVGLLEQTPQFMNDRPPFFVGRDDLETLMASDQVTDWIKITELLLGPAGAEFKFTPKHRSNSYTTAAATTTTEAAGDVAGDVEG